MKKQSWLIVKLQVLGLELGVDFAFAWDNNNNLIREEIPSRNGTMGCHGRGFKRIACQCEFNPDFYLLNNSNLHQLGLNHVCVILSHIRDTITSV